MPAELAVVLAAIDLAHDPDVILAAAARHAKMRKDADVHLVHAEPLAHGDDGARDTHRGAGALREVHRVAQKAFFGRLFIHVTSATPGATSSSSRRRSTPTSCSSARTAERGSPAPSVGSDRRERRAPRSVLRAHKKDPPIARRPRRERRAD